jgi:serine protease Do
MIVDPKAITRNQIVGTIVIIAILGGIFGGATALTLCGRNTSSEAAPFTSTAVRNAVGSVVTIRSRAAGQSSVTQEHIGCGVVFAGDGYVVTNEHMVAGATEIKVRTDDGKELVAKVIGSDKSNDLAVIKIDARLSPAELGTSSSVRVGDDVVVIGKPFVYSSEYTVTKGIISAIPKNLPKGFPELIQTDAVINPGNSGGPLCDTKGRVIGITTAYLSTGESASGIGFAVPIDLVKQVFDRLTKKK